MIEREKEIEILKKDPQKFKLNLTQILAILIFFYSSIVMAGWVLNIDALTRILSDGINMQFATAFGFFLSSIALWCNDQSVNGNREIPQLILPATTILILLIMVTLLVGEILGVRTGISDLFLEGNNVPYNPHPGIPSLVTMINFILFCIASIISLFESPTLKQKLSYLGVPIILLGVIACFGYLFQIPLLYYKISEMSTPMAFNTAILFVCLGFGLVVIQRNQKNENKP